MIRGGGNVAGNRMVCSVPVQLTSLRSISIISLMENTPPDPYLRMHAVNIYVEDQEKSLRFYVDKRGFQIAFDARIGSRQRLLAVAPPDGTAVLALVQPEPGSPQAQLIGRATQVVFVTDDVPATYSEWRRRGVRFHGAPR